MAEPYAIQTKGLTKSYGDIQALRGVKLAVEPGTIFGFLGPNGSGKTTFIRCLLDLIRPDKGTVSVLGVDPQLDPVAVRARTGYLPGELNVEENLTVGKQLAYYRDLRGKQLDWTFVEQLAKRLELDLNRSIKNLSKGNKQKVGIVQALMHRPDLLLLDEPTSGLDPLMQHEVYRLLREAQQGGATVFFSSHIISEVEAVADRVAIIRKGLIVEEADPRQLVSMTLRQVQVRFKEQVDTSPLIQIPGITLLEASNGQSAQLQVAGDIDALIKGLAQFPISDFEIKRPSLEELFLVYYEGGEPEEV